MSEETISRIKERRLELNLTQDDLAKAANLTPAAISQFETGTRKPSFSTLSSLSDSLKVTVDYLLGKEDRGYEDLIADPIIKVMFRGMMDFTEESKACLFELYKFLKDQETAASKKGPEDIE